MITHGEVSVSVAEFVDAVARVSQMRRAPAGASSSMPRDTILSPDKNGLMVEAPAMSSSVHCNPLWRVIVAVDARRLLEVCEQFKKLGASKEKGAVFLLSVASGQLKVKFKATSAPLPLVEGKTA